MIGVGLSITGIRRGGGDAPPLPVWAPPPANWRMPATVATSVGASASALTSASASASAKSRPAVVAVADDWIEWTVGAAGSALLSWITTTDAVAITRNGEAVTYAPAFPAGSTAADRRQFVRVTVAAGDKLRLTMGAAATIRPLLHLMPDTGSWDAHLVIGASREVQGLRSLDLEAVITARWADRDPLIFNYSRSGATLQDILPLAAVAGPHYAGVAHWALIGSVIGNNITNARPYAAGQKSALDAGLETLMGHLSGYQLAIGNTSWRNYADVSPDAQGNGSLPYNDAVIHPAILQYAPDYYDASLQRARVDEYLAVLYERGSLSDAAHGAVVAQRAIWRDSHFAWVYTGSWGALVSQAEARVAAAEAVASSMAQALPAYNEASHALAAIAPTAPARPALAARLAAIYPTAMQSDANRLVTVAEASGTQLDKDAAQVAVNAASSAGANVTALQSRLDAIVILSFDQVIRINHGAATGPAGWNSTAAIALGVAVADLLTEAGASTGIGMEITNAATGVNTNTGLISAVAEIPSAVLASVTADTSNSFAFHLTGLDPARRYDLILMPSRSTTTSSATFVRYSVQGVVQSPEIDPKSNVSVTLTVPNVAPDAEGRIAIIAARGTGASYAYHTATILRRRT